MDFDDFLSYHHHPHILALSPAAMDTVFRPAASHHDAYFYRSSPHTASHHAWAQSPADPGSERPYFSSIHDAANALLNLSESAPTRSPYRKALSHHATPASAVSEFTLVTPLPPIHESPSDSWSHYPNSISPIQRTSSPGIPRSFSGRYVNEAPVRRASTSYAHDRSPISPLSDISSSSSGSAASAPETTTTAPTSSSQATGAPTSPGVITADDWEPSTGYRLRTRSRALTSASVGRTDQSQSQSSSSISPNSSTRKRVKAPSRAQAGPVRKKVRTAPEVKDDGPVVLPRRTFPANVPINEEFPLFYRRFPVPSHTRTGKRGCVPRLCG